MRQTVWRINVSGMVVPREEMDESWRDELWIKGAEMFDGILFEINRVI